MNDIDGKDAMTIVDTTGKDKYLIDKDNKIIDLQDCKHEFQPSLIDFTSLKPEQYAMVLFNDPSVFICRLCKKSLKEIIKCQV